MATAYVKNKALSIYSAPNVNAVITKIERSGQTEAHTLSGFSEGTLLGVLTGEKQDGFVQVEYKFDIRRKISSTKKWLWALPAAGILGSQLSQWTKETEKIWVLEEDISNDSLEDTADAKKQADDAKKKADRDKLLADINKNVGGSGDTNDKPKSNKTILVVAISGAVAVLMGVLWWAFGKKKGQAQVAAQQPTIVRLSEQNNKTLPQKEGAFSTSGRVLPEQKP